MSPDSSPDRPATTGGRGGRRSDGHRPPWWPNSEPWPPRRGTWRGRDWGGKTGPGAAWSGPPWSASSDGVDGPPWGGRWRAGRRPFIRRFGCLFLLVVLLAVAAGAAGVWAIGTASGVIESHPAARALAIAAVIVGVLLLIGVARAVRSFARPVDELVDAAGRVEEGDYSARVNVHGPGDVRSLARAFNAMSSRLEETDRQRRAYLADVTHELRTPLTVIQAQLEAVLDGVHPADADHLAPILDQVRTLDGLIDDLRTLTLVETGRLTLRLEPVDIAVLLSDSVAAFASSAEEAGVTMNAESAPDIPVVEADPVRVRSVVSNLLANALRHTPDGGRVTVSAVASGPSLHVTVRDSGPGFGPDVLPRAFERFVKSDDSPGSGLGLAIARDLVLAHGGTIGARNDVAGAVVEFTLPLAAAPGEP